jgi:hypothetical protein
MSSSEVIGLIEQLCIGLARTLYDRGVRPTDEKSVRLVRKKLLAAAQQDNDCFRVASAIDHLYRVIVFRKNRPTLFRVDDCNGEKVAYYRVVLSESGEIRSDSGKFLNPNSAVEAAERFYYLIAWPGSTVTLLAVLDNGQIIKCSECQVDAE